VDWTYVGKNLELGSSDDRFTDTLERDLELQATISVDIQGQEGRETDLETMDSAHVDVDRNVKSSTRVRSRDNGSDLFRSLVSALSPYVKSSTHVSKVRLLDTSLDNTRSSLVCADDQFGGDDGRRDGLGGVDDLLDTRDSKGDVHRGDSGEMERLERHLSTRLSNRLSTNGSDGSSYTHSASVMHIEAKD
jgi:hypothetical protein